MIVCFSTITPTISLSSETTGVGEESKHRELERDMENSFQALTDSPIAQKVFLDESAIHKRHSSLLLVKYHFL